MSSPEKKHPVPPLSLADKALFIDVEGTLIPSASKADEAIFPPALLSLLHELQKATHGAFALVSDRNTSDLRGLCQNLPLNLITVRRQNWPLT